MTKKNIYRKIFVFLPIIFVIFILGSVNFALALEVNYPRIPGAIPPQDFIGSVPADEILSYFVKYIFNLIIWASGIIIFGVLIYAGIQYLTSTGKPEKLLFAKEQLSAVFLGVLILLSSYLILKTINPQFIAPQIPKPETIKSIEKPSVPPPPTEEFRSSINTEIPFGTIIERGVFEGTLPWKEGERIPRINNNATTTKDIINKLTEQSQNLQDDAKECTCRTTDPVPACGNIKTATPQGDITWQCGCTGDCLKITPCTCDPCKSVRGDIQSTEDKNKQEIDNLVKEQMKTENEVLLLKEQLGRLERVEKFMTDCYSWIANLSDFLVKKTDYAEKKWVFTKINFWEDVLIKGDWATFYCPVSGSIMGQAEYITPAGLEKELENKPVETPQPKQQTSCIADIPVGEIIDRTIRTGYKLIERMEELIGLDKQMINAVDKLQVLISQCSSQRGCERRCSCYPCLCPHHGHCGPGCIGWASCCADSSLPYPGLCLERDEDTPCPYKEIDDQIKEIKNISNRIAELVDGKNNEGEETPEQEIANIGITSIIKDVIPKIFEDLEIKIREPMKHCVSETVSDVSDSEASFKGQMVLSNCESATKEIGANGVIIQNCCLDQPEFQGCLGLCYLEKGDKLYKDCLQNCLEKKAKELETSGYKEESDILKTCRHKLNFYCCGG